MRRGLAVSARARARQVVLKMYCVSSDPPQRAFIHVYTATINKRIYTYIIACVYTVRCASDVIVIIIIVVAVVARSKVFAGREIVSLQPWQGVRTPPTLDSSENSRETRSVSQARLSYAACYTDDDNNT